MATTLLRAALTRYEVTVLAKPHARPLLSSSFPEIQFIEWDAPWTVFRGKYFFWRWHWTSLLRLIRRLRSEHFAVGISVRKDPRDHLLMWVPGIPQRVGIAHRLSRWILNRPVPAGIRPRHVVEDWRAISEALGLAMDHSPTLARSGALHCRLSPAANDKPVLCLHVGARIPVRRWPEVYFADLISRLRKEFDFYLLLIPDPDGYGRGLASQADEVVDCIPLDQLVFVLSTADLVLCNDSAPSHIAAACGRPVITLFGPTDPVRFGPWGDEHLVVQRNFCPYRPCFDYCKFKEPFCLTRLRPELIWAEVKQHAAKYLNAKVVNRTS